MQYNCLEHTSRPHDPIERSSAPTGPKCVQRCKESAYSEVFITNFNAVGGHVWLAERGPRRGRDFVFEGRCRGKASSRASRAMLTPTMTLAVFNVSCLAMYTGKVWSESTSEAFQRLCPTTTTPTPATTSPRTRAREAPNLKFLRIAPKPPSGPHSQRGCWCDH